MAILWAGCGVSTFARNGKDRNIASWITLDTQASYRVGISNASWLDETELLLTATNILDR
ncbi:MAG: hypothetical protein JWO80_2020, partial [Bryobacterales bacterium]|nr:hypothetical protein [Bryobacterales bacterium]